jgi:fructokinase
MAHYIGLDIGGTKISGAVLTEDGKAEASFRIPTPKDYEEFLNACVQVIDELEKQAEKKCSVGVGIPGVIDEESGLISSGNLPLNGRFFHADLEKSLGVSVRLANDSNCIALAEYVDGAGAGYKSVLGYNMGTGIGSGFIFDGKIVNGRHGLTGEIGHLPLPFREPEDGPVVTCGWCRQGCVEQSISGGALARLYAFMTGEEADGKMIAERAIVGDTKALRVLDRYFEVVAKAMIIPLYALDPDIIVISGGLNSLPGLYDEVPKRWEKYSVSHGVKTKLVPAYHGPESGLRGAAWLWR